ncbi:S-adenosylmethionine decarboxylase [Candidatus Magnetobacterium casensis]|uniref:S-adenosylmethionine decarboxylase n=1 Tax=Candidatus Magnetobacterium casense TaxID=1455061 RepID=A0ABS6S568_9BACT|nr:S-adenosylmethionine decarboxylase [Candidatus Magnetobacterium casensis]
MPRSAIHLAKMARDIIDLVGMTIDGDPDIRHYPTPEGNGGQGIQLYQPLVESWLILGTWPEHGFLRVNLSSCKPYDIGIVRRYLELLGNIEAEWLGEL